MFDGVLVHIFKIKWLQSETVIKFQRLIKRVACFKAEITSVNHRKAVSSDQEKDVLAQRTRVSAGRRTCRTAGLLPEENSFWLEDYFQSAL